MTVCTSSMLLLYTMTLSFFLMCYVQYMLIAYKFWNAAVISLAMCDMCNTQSGGIMCPCGSVTVARKSAVV